MSEKPENISYNEAKLKAANFCAYQERTQQQVREKLLNLGTTRDETEEIIAELINENFLNEERFAKSYASGHFRLKKWGKNKIYKHLKLLSLSDFCIKVALEEIDSEEYNQQISNLIARKVEYFSVSDKYNIYQMKDKVSRFLINKGFEPELVWEELNKQVKDDKSRLGSGNY